MKYPGSLVIAILEKISYETQVTITHFPCSVTIRKDLADSLVNVGFIELDGGGYKLTVLGQLFLNNSIQ